MTGSLVPRTLLQMSLLVQSVYLAAGPANMLWILGDYRKFLLQPRTFLEVSLLQPRGVSLLPPTSSLGIHI